LEDGLGSAKEDCEGGLHTKLADFFIKEKWIGQKEEKFLYKTSSPEKKAKSK
jgi:hypothetical protein